MGVERWLRIKSGEGVNGGDEARQSWERGGKPSRCLSVDREAGKNTENARAATVRTHLYETPGIQPRRVMKIRKVLNYAD